MANRKERELNHYLEKTILEGYLLNEVASRGAVMTALAKELRDRVLAPQPRKAAPTFTVGQLAEICKLDRNRVNYLIDKAASPLPKGDLEGRLRSFSLNDVYAWLKHDKNYKSRPEHVPGSVICVANFKGGQGKTSTSMCLAQGLSLRGRKVLMVDLDPQGSLTELGGYYADIEIDEEHTIAPYLESFMEDTPMDSLEPFIRETYWEGLDLVPASSSLFGAEFNFPSIVRKRPNFPIWTLLRRGLAPLRKKYDYVIIDTAPSLSYLTVNALMAADSILMPLVPKSLDFISSIQFWNLFTDLTKMMAGAEPDKRYDLIRIVLSMANSQDISVPVVRSWVQKAYGDWLSPIEIPLSSAATTGSLGFNTIYDQYYGSKDASKKTLDRLREPFNELCKSVDEFYTQKWSLA